MSSSYQTLANPPMDQISSNNVNNVDPLDFPMDDQDILDEFLDQRVYEVTDGTSPISNMNRQSNNSSNTGISNEINHSSGINSHTTTTNNNNDNNNNTNNDLNDQFDLDSGANSNNYNLGSLENLDIGSFYQPSPDYMIASNNHSGFHSPEGVSPQSFQQAQRQQQHNDIVQGSASMPGVQPELKLESNSNYSTPPEKTIITAYDYARSELAKLKFGNPSMSPQPNSVSVPDPMTYLDFSPQTMSGLPFKLELSNLPTYSRVETQIKLKFSLSPPPSSFLLHIPQDLISKSKFCLKDSIHSMPEEFKKHVLFLDTYVLTSDLKKSCTICSRCIKREQKRASRRKSAIFGEQQDTMKEEQIEEVSPKANNNSWSDENMSKKAIIFNCKEIVSFPPPNGLSNDLKKSLELSIRIVCYCRHHKESKGFKLLFVVKDYTGKIVAKNISSPIMIMDRKKTTGGGNNSRIENSLPNSVSNSSTNLAGLGSTAASASGAEGGANSSSNLSTHPVIPDSGLESLHPLSPNSIDGESNSEPTNTDTDRGLKRKKLSVDDSFNTSSNPMFNGSSNNFSPISNSDTNTNTSTHNYFMKPSSSANLLNPLNSLMSQSTHQQSQQSQQSNGGPPVPSIQRIIPAQGPIRGGIEVTLLGFNFRPGLMVKFGSNQALATHCWSETTIVTYLPPASQPGQVLVSFENESLMLGSVQQQQVFTYTDDTDRQLIELALQIVGLKMNGKLEDAKNIAKRIVGTDERNGGGSNESSGSVAGATNAALDQESSGYEWFDNAHKAVEILTKSDLSTEDILINFLSLVDLPNCPIILLNWQLCTNQGQTLLHLATLKNYSNLIKFLITHGCKIDVKDNQGLTPLFFASMCGHRELISLFVECKSNYNLKLANEKHLIDYCDPNVLDIFNNLSDNEADFSKGITNSNPSSGVLSKSISMDSLNSLFTMSYGRHISKMVGRESSEISTFKKLESGDRHIVRREFKPTDEKCSDVYDDSNDSSEFADSEFESNDEDYDDYGDVETLRNSSLNETRGSSSSSNTTITATGNGSLWQKVKNVFNNDEDIELPSYDDLFPFRDTQSTIIETSSSKILEVQREGTSGSTTNNSKDVQTDVQHEEDSGITSDSSDDLMISYKLHNGRKTVKNDKMLLFFWFPALIVIGALFVSISVMGYKFDFIEDWKVYFRSIIGNLMVGNERVIRVFQHERNGIRELLT
ncbi:protein Mga2p [[Candida] railenensis]|uniref:Protein Mga2p n=1 Tax=[Candida] railenensis TaxID=45579 RepID=A0A9P0QRF4_9ASCO|nr:protein Mga2p [[Candida] railenensis]